MKPILSLSLIAALAVPSLLNSTEAWSYERADRPARTQASRAVSGVHSAPAQSHRLPSLPKPSFGASLLPAVQGPGYYRPYRPHVHGPSVRLWIGPPPLYAAPYPYWYPYPYPYGYRPVPPVVVVPAAPPPVYVEGGSPQAPSTEAPPSAYWYWCESRSAYHPVAPDCPEGWVAVPPRPAGAQ